MYTKKANSAVLTSSLIPSLTPKKLNKYKAIQGIVSSLKQKGNEVKAGCGYAKTKHHLLIYWPHLLRNAGACCTLAEHLSSVFPKKLQLQLSRHTRMAYKDTQPILRDCLERCAGPLWLRSFSDMNFYHDVYLKYQPDYANSLETKMNVYNRAYSYTVIQLVADEDAYSRVLAAPSKNDQIRRYDSKLPAHVWSVLHVWRLLSSRHLHDTDLTSFGLNYCSNGYMSVDWNAFIQHPAMQTIGFQFPSEIYNILIAEENKPKITGLFVSPPGDIPTLTANELDSLVPEGLPLYTRLAREQKAFKYGLSHHDQYLAALTFIDPRACYKRNDTWFNGEWYERTREHRKVMARALVEKRREARVPSPSHAVKSGDRKQFIFRFRPMDALKRTGVPYEHVWFTDFIDESFVPIDIERSLRRMANQKVPHPYVDETEDEAKDSNDQTLLAKKSRRIRAAQKELDQRLDARFKQESKNDLYAIFSRRSLYFALPLWLYADKDIKARFAEEGESETWRRALDLVTLQHAYIQTAQIYRNVTLKSEFMLNLSEEERDTLVRHAFVYASRTFLLLTDEQQKEFKQTLILDAEAIPFACRQTNANIFKRHRKLITTYFTNLVPSILQEISVRVSRVVNEECAFNFYSPYFFFLLEKISRCTLGQPDKLLTRFAPVRRCFTEGLKPSYLLLALSSFARTAKYSDSLSAKRVPSSSLWSPQDDLFLLCNYPYRRRHLTPADWNQVQSNLSTHTRASIKARIGMLHKTMTQLVPGTLYFQAFSVRDCFKNSFTAFRIVLLYGLYRSWKVSSLQKTKAMLPVAIIGSLPDEFIEAITETGELKLPPSYHSDFYNNRFIGIELSRLKEEYDSRRDTPESVQSVEKTAEPESLPLVPAVDNTESCHVGM